MSSTETLLQQGIAAARAGRRGEARALLMRVVEDDERSEQGWLWLAGVVDDPGDMRTCLANVLDLNPDNVKAQQGLAWIDARYGPRAAPEPDPAPPEAEAPRQDAVSYTGPTTRLEPQESAAEPTPAPPPAHAQSDPKDAVAPATSPCPYCGTPTAPNQKRCTQCRNSLMIRSAPRAQRSLALTILGWLWCIGGVLSLLGGVLLLALPFIPQNGGLVEPNQPVLPAANGVVSTLGGMLYLAIGRGLLRRARWAYIVNGILMGLGLLGFLLAAIAGGGLLFAVMGGFGGRPAPDQARVAGTILGAILFCMAVWWLIVMLLNILSYRDFYGPSVRFLPTVEATDHVGHYNSGVAYKNRGMWYMATKEWEAAVRKTPRDLNYLHALGLAYAQLGQFAQARATLDAALAIAPADPRIQESRALVDRMAER